MTVPNFELLEHGATEMTAKIHMLECDKDNLKSYENQS